MTVCTKIQGTPGTGKTHTLLNQYQQALNQDYTTEDITVCTFRRDAAQDIVDKIGVTPQGDTRNYLNTIHGICYRMLGCPEVVKPADMRKFSAEYGYKTTTATNADEEAAYSGGLFDMYSWFMNTRTHPTNYTKYPGLGNVKINPETIPQFMDDWNEYKQNIVKVDYSDMIEHAIQGRYDCPTPVLMVDEFQDLTAQQYELFLQWKKSADKVIIAGDPLQSIYGFFGGSPDYFKGLNAKEIVLNHSHRLYTPIWDYAKRIVKGQHVPDVTTSPTDDKIIKSTTEIKHHEGTVFHLIRCNYQATDIAQRLARSGIVYSGLLGWSSGEVNLFNAIASLRRGYEPTAVQVCALLESYPLKYFNGKGPKDTRKKQILKQPTLTAGMIKRELRTTLQSNNPFALYTKKTELRKKKIMGRLKITTDPIKPEDPAKVKILTIHGSKGMEADTVYLYSTITTRIKRDRMRNKQTAAEESRIWYVGVTRAKERLFIVPDGYHRYPLPKVVA